MSNHIEITVADHEAYVAAVAERDALRKRVAELEAVPLRIVLDQGPPTEPGDYVFRDVSGVGLIRLDPDDLRSRAFRNWLAPAKWSRRLDIVAQESEVGG